MDENKRGNYIGKHVGDYVIIDKKRVNKRIKYYVRCSVCGVEKWVFNVKNLKHGKLCDGKHRKTGSKLIGVQYGDYVVVDKNVKNNRSSYIMKCTKCNSIKEVYNVREFYHNEYCHNFLESVLGEIVGDFIITKAYRKERVYVDVECLKCGSKRVGVAYKDFKSTFNNKHGAICTIKNLSKYPNKKLVRKLLRTYQNINTRLRTESAYKDVKNLFVDSVDFVTYVYDMFNERLIEGNKLEKLSIDRINPFGNYEKGNVRCLTLTEQQYNKRVHYQDSVETIESSVCDERVA